MKKIVTVALFSALALSGCKGRQEYETELNYAKPLVYFGGVKEDAMPNMFYSTKLGFADLNCDGITDMMVLKDDSGLFEKQDFNASIYDGYYDKNGILKFKPNYKKMNLPFYVNLSGGYKLDSVNLNNDQCTDIVYTNFQDTSDGDLTLKFAINIGEHKLIPLEQKYNNKHYYQTGIGTLGNHFIEFIHDMQDKYSYNDEDHDIYSYLKQDWCDFDGSGTDDFVMMWNANDSMAVMIAYSSHEDGAAYNKFVDYKTYFIPRFLSGRSVEEVDTEDFNGDGKCDIISYNNNSKSINTSIAYFNGNRFMPTKTVTYKYPEGLDTFSTASKVDTFDRNNDGKADLNYITERDDKPVIVTFYAN